MIESGWRLETGGWGPGAGETNSQSHHRGLSLSSFSSSSLQPPASGLSFSRRSGFTLVELLITVSVIAIMATMVLFALFAAQETAKAQKTKSLIAKLDSIIKAKYETYKTRRVPILIPPPPPTTDPFYVRYTATVARARLDCLRDLMRMELPDRWSDIEDPPKTFNYGGIFTNIQVAQPSVSQGYYRRWNAATPKPTGEFAGAECLYLIVMAAQAEEADDRSAIRPDQIGDVDQDGFPEFLDAWGQPIKFLRWAPGFVSELQVVATGKFSGSVTSSNHDVTFTANGQQLSQSAGSYVGGAIIQRDIISGEMKFSEDKFSSLTGYQFGGGLATITSNTPAYTNQKPFRNTSGLSGGDEFFILAPDPFDPRAVYPLYNTTGSSAPPVPDTSVPTFALYPLIYSSGPNKSYGICADFDGASPHRYVTFGVNPFHVGTDNVDGQKRMIGGPRDEPGEPNFVPRAWIDNIHNHMITAR